MFISDHDDSLSISSITGSTTGSGGGVSVSKAYEGDEVLQRVQKGHTI
jgi:hypothetical protein